MSLSSAIEYMEKMNLKNKSQNILIEDLKEFTDINNSIPICRGLLDVVKKYVTHNAFQTNNIKFESSFNLHALMNYTYSENLENISYEDVTFLKSNNLTVAFDLEYLKDSWEGLCENNSEEILETLYLLRDKRNILLEDIEIELFDDSYALISYQSYKAIAMMRTICMFAKYIDSKSFRIKVTHIKTKCNNIFKTADFIAKNFYDINKTIWISIHNKSMYISTTDSLQSFQINLDLNNNALLSYFNNVNLNDLFDFIFNKEITINITNTESSNKLLISNLKEKDSILIKKMNLKDLNYFLKGIREKVIPIGTFMYYYSKIFDDINDENFVEIYNKEIIKYSINKIPNYIKKRLKI